jgi:hypothetical protein
VNHETAEEIAKDLHARVLALKPFP